MSEKTRFLVFIFFGNLIAISLLLVCLTTNSWINSYPKNRHSNDSVGELQYGLFYGSGKLNIGYGFRPRNFSVYNDIIINEQDVMNFWLWLVTVVATAFALLGNIISAIASIIKTATPTKKDSVLILILTNSSSAFLSLAAALTWAVQFFLYLKHNVVLQKDRKDGWYSNHRTSLGYGFHLLIVSIVIAFVNFIALVIIKRNDIKSKRKLEEYPTSDEKNQGVMLY